MHQIVGSGYLRVVIPHVIILKYLSFDPIILLLGIYL